VVVWPVDLVGRVSKHGSFDPVVFIGFAIPLVARGLRMDPASRPWPRPRREIGTWRVWRG
jgi:hypothetical protein